MGKKPAGAIGTFSTYTFGLMEDFDESPSAALKRAAILFDSLVFHPQGTLVGLDVGGRESMSKTEWLSAFASHNKDEQKFLAKSDDFAELVFLTDEFVDDTPRFYRNVDSIFANKDLYDTVQEWASQELKSRGIEESNNRDEWMD